MEKQSSKGRAILLPTILGGIFLFLSVFTVAIAALCALIPEGQGVIEGETVAYGVRGAIQTYMGIWTPSGWKHWVVYVCQTLIFFSGVLFLLNLTIALIRKQAPRIVSAFLLSLGIALLPYFLFLYIPLLKLNLLDFATRMILSCATSLNVLGVVLLIAAAGPIIYGRREKAPEVAPVEEPKPEPVPTLIEKEVREIAHDLIHEHVLDRHKDMPAQEPVADEEPEPVAEILIEEDPEEAEVAPEEPKPAVEEKSATIEKKEEGNGVFGNGRRRAKFETRLRNSDYDIRHKYYDLRDYIKWYGVNNRLSIPGDTFSLHRERFAFITITGKHIRIYLALNPDAYQGTTYPVERATAAKFEDVPCMMKVRSDLSFRRAKKLIDDVMREKGIARPEGPEPKETQEEK